tara:strand:+ start:1008 stop:1223 length:216 start_codon:yes stop_codon:yes gene_type:complete
MSKKVKSAEELKRYALLRAKMLKKNNERPESERMSVDQINRRASEAVRDGHVNSHGNIVRPEWDSIQPIIK